MIKTEVVVNGDWFEFGNRSIKQNQYLDWVVFLDGKHEKTFKLLEQAIKHCLEQKPHKKYNWSLIPEHVQFMATDEDGMACGWLVKPQIMGDAWRNQFHLSAFFNINARDNYLNHYRGDWKESLEKRPEEKDQ